MARPKKINIEGKTSCLVTNFCDYKHRCCHFCKRETCYMKCKDELTTCKYLTETIEEKPKETPKQPEVSKAPKQVITYGGSAKPKQEEIPKKEVKKRGPKPKAENKSKPIPEPVKRGRGRPPKKK